MISARASGCIQSLPASESSINSSVAFSISRSNMALAWHSIRLKVSSVLVLILFLIMLSPITRWNEEIRLQPGFMQHPGTFSPGAYLPDCSARFEVSGFRHGFYPDVTFSGVENIADPVDVEAEWTYPLL